MAVFLKIMKLFTPQKYEDESIAKSEDGGDYFLIDGFVPLKKFKELLISQRSQQYTNSLREIN